MIKIRNLTKIYNSNKNNICTAINNLSLDLPNKGFVFVVGKSGSGKSTLLNMIGTLDSVTSGDIIVNNVNIARFKEKDTLNYRCSEIGYIFQNYILLEELTVKENISLSLDLSGNNNESLITDVLEKVDLVGLENKFPNELSGGQCQRVAIARALIKQPEILLCDEPTGNLDFKTSNQILKILKEFSKEKLVIIVSHNLQDAEMFADRIIELDAGKILSDKSRSNKNINELIFKDNLLILPHHKDLTKEEVNKVNNYIKENKVQFKQNTGSFEDTVVVDEEENKQMKNISSLLTNKNQFKISRMFGRKNKTMALYTILITTLFISILFVLEMFILFNANDSLGDNFEENPVVVNSSKELVPGSVSVSYLHDIDDNMINKFYENGYTGNIYKVYNKSLNFGGNYMFLGTLSRFEYLLNNGYIRETLGTVCCDEQYLTKLFGINGNIVMLAGSLDSANSKTIITDYVADSLINNKLYSVSADYNGVYNKYKNQISGIVYTGYKEKYSDVIKIINSSIKEGKSFSEITKENKNNALMKKFFDDIYSHLGFEYLFSNNFYDDFVYDNSIYTIAYVYISSDGYDPYYVGDTHITSYKSTTLKDNEIIMNYELYNKIFGTAYAKGSLDQFEPHTIKLYRLSNIKSGEVVGEVEMYVKGLTTINTQFSVDLYDDLINTTIKCYGLMFDNPSQKNVIMKTVNELDLLVFEHDTPSSNTVYMVISVFKPLFIFMIILLSIFSIGHIILYGISSIKKNSYEIGVLKSLGTKNKYINKIFLIKVFSISLIIGFTSIIGIILTSFLANELLCIAFSKVIRSELLELNIISIKPLVIIINIVLVWIISLISSLLPIMYLRKIKPLDILRENKK